MVVFDFDGALTVAKKLEQLAKSIERQRKKHDPPRDEVLDDWLGTVGRQFKALRASHDRKGDPLPAALRRDAERWAGEWVKAVKKYNQEAYDLAVERTKVHNEFQRQAGAEELRPPELPDTPSRPKAPYFGQRGYPFARYEFDGKAEKLTHQRFPAGGSATGAVW